jgi:transcriptional regulator with XRE-family HTH domain
VTTLGDKIRRLRKEKGYTLEKLAELADSSKSYVWELENKQPPRPSAEKISKVARVLGVTGEYLLDPADTEVAAATDEAFYRKYRRMDSTTKERIRRMVDVWDDDEK